MKKSLAFRTWFYFRWGWSTYFAFIFAAINTLTVTYYLAIERVPVLVAIFPSFAHYITITAVIAIPILVSIGYLHFKRSPAYRAEASVGIESNPYQQRWLVNTELSLKMNLQLIDMILKLNKDNLSDEEHKKIQDFKDEISEFVKDRTFANKKDLNFMKELDLLPGKE